MSAARPRIERNLGFLVADLSRLARFGFDRRVRDLELTRAHWLFLYYLARQPGCTQSEFAEILQLKKITVSRRAKRLEKAGWLARDDLARDGRAHHLKLTGRARRTVRDLELRADRLRDHYLEGVSSRHRRILLTASTVIKKESPPVDRSAPIIFS